MPNPEHEQGSPEPTKGAANAVPSSEPAAIAVPVSKQTPRPGVRRLFGATLYARRAFVLVWQTNRRLSLGLLAFGLVAGALPVAIAWIGKLVIDATLTAIAAPSDATRTRVIVLLGVELLLVAALLAAYRALSLCDALLRVQLGQRITELVLRKAQTFTLKDFENPEIYDELTRVKQQAATRPLALVRGALASLQDAISLAGYGALIVRFSPLLVLVLFCAAVPAIFAELRFNADAFRLFRRKTPETRRQDYLEVVLSREDYAKEVSLFELAPTFMAEHRRIFDELFVADRRLAIKRGAWGFGLGLLGAAALAISYAWVAWAAIFRRISIGEMTMLFVVLKQAEAIVATLLVSVASMYEDNLYVSMLERLLAHPVEPWTGTFRSGTKPGDGIRFEAVSFTYPGRSEPALEDVSFQVKSGETLAITGRNGAGKSTIVKLMTALYPPSSGRVLLDGRDLRDWDRRALKQRMAIVLQDFAQYQLSAGHNVGVGDVRGYDDIKRWKQAARRALADEDIASLPAGYETQLGRWFADGQELSAGQWQRIALARLFMRDDADILILDEPTSSLDRAAEAAILDAIRARSDGAITIVISHRPAATRIADRVLVLERGGIVEQGRHAELVEKSGVYAELFGSD